MSETKHPLLEGYTPPGSESITKPSYKPPELVIKAFEEGIKVKNLFKDRNKPPEDAPKPKNTKAEEG